MSRVSSLFDRGRAAAYLVPGSDFFDVPQERLLTSPFAELIRRDLPAEWLARADGPWVFFTPPDVSLPSQGWKLHISSRSDQASRAINLALPVLMRFGAPFKVIANVDLLRRLNGKAADRGSGGKFITAYPQHDQWSLVADALAAALQEVDGPFILSDRRHPDSRCVFYRYGQIRLDAGIEADGTPRFVISDPVGNLIADQRAPSSKVPNWLADPYEPQLRPDTTVSAFLARFTITKVLSFSNSGGVYLAKDSLGRSSVLKEARAHVGYPRGEEDARAALTKEFEILQALHSTGAAVPTPYGLEDVWEHRYLNQEYVTGIPLGAWSIAHSPAITGENNRWPDYLDQLPSIWLQLCDFVAHAHGLGITLGDFAANNVLVGEADGAALQLTFIDFEGAVRGGIDSDLGVFTLPFAAPERLGGEPLSKSDDLFALGQILLGTLAFGPVHGPFSVETWEATRDLLARRCPIPLSALGCISQLLARDPRQRPSAASIGEAIESAFRAPPLPLGRPEWADVATDVACDPDDQLWADAAVRLTAVNIIADASDSGGPGTHLYPCDPSGFKCGNGFSIAYGAAGVIHALDYVGEELPADHVAWFLRQDFVGDHLSPGLYTGSAGAAWVLANLGQAEAARDTLAALSNQIYRLRDPSVFCGSGGIALSWLHLYDQSRQPLDLAGAAAWAHHTLRLRGADEADAPNAGYAFGLAGDLLMFSEMSLRDPSGPWLDHAYERWLAVDKALVRDDAERVVGLGSRKSNRVSQYWADGTAGVLTALCRFYTASQDERLSPKLAQLADSLYHDFIVMGGLFSGAAGLGNALLDLYQLSDDKVYLRNAWQFARVLRCYVINRGQGISFLGHQNARIAHDFGTGSAGIMCFLHRLRTNSTSGPFDLVPSPARSGCLL